MATGKIVRLRRARLIAVAVSICFVGCAEDPETYVGDRSEPVATEPSAPPVTAPPSRAPKKVTITWTGCGISKVAYMIKAAAEYKQARGVDVVVTGGGATRGIRATAGGISDIGGTCRHCLPESQPQEDGAVMTHVAWDALVFFTHPSNPVDDLSLEQARSILLGESSNWSDVGGPDEPIVRVFRKQTKDGKLSGVGYMTRLLVFDEPSTTYTSDALFERSSGPVEQFVERTEFSFAVTGVSSANKRKVKILALDGVVPSRANIASGKYALFRPLYLVTRGEPTGPTKEFLDWIVGPDGQAVIGAEGTVTLKEGKALQARFQHWPQKAGLVRNH